MAGALLKRFVEAPRPCSYLPDATAQIEFRLMLHVDARELEEMLVRGWRRFGPIYFRPACAPCAECVSLRIPVDRFAPAPRHVRARRRCGRFRSEVGPPRLDRARLELYRLWHAGREERRGWEAASLDAEGYFEQFAFPHPAARELSLWDGGQLVAVSLCDVTPRAWSAVYFFYHPRIARLSPGVANVVLCTELARAQGIPHVYLGYRVAGCRSLAYKSDYHPHEVLVGRPGFDEAPAWREVEAETRVI